MGESGEQKGREIGGRVLDGGKSDGTHDGENLKEQKGAVGMRRDWQTTSKNKVLVVRVYI